MIVTSRSLVHQLVARHAGALVELVDVWRKHKVNPETAALPASRLAQA